MHEEVRPVDDVDRGSPGLAGRQGFDLAVKVATGAFDPKTLAPMTHNRTTYPRTTYITATRIGRQNASVNPGSVL
jgi:hypothetical protein